MKRKRHQVVNVEQSRLDAIEKRLIAITPGPWRCHGEDIITDNLKVTVAFISPAAVAADRNADFIAHSPEDVDYLLACIESLREDIDDLQEELEAANNEDDE